MTLKEGYLQTRSAGAATETGPHEQWYSISDYSSNESLRFGGSETSAAAATTGTLEVVHQQKALATKLKLHLRRPSEAM